MNILKWKGLDIDPMKITESIITKPSIGQVDTEFKESSNSTDITTLYPKIEAIHAGRTRNYNRYLADKLKGDPDLRSGVYSWTQPYPKPVIYNHDIETEATGRVYSASYSEFTAAGSPGIIVTPKITHEKAIKDILEGRLLTVSIGASTNAAVCSICSTDIINEGFCGHYRGEEYDGEVAEWIAGDLWFDELSWVNVPADSEAMITTVDTGNSTAGIIASEEGKEEKIVVGSTSESTKLTDNPKVVKSVNETTEKEDKTLEDKEQKETKEDLVETNKDEVVDNGSETVEVETEEELQDNNKEKETAEPTQEDLAETTTEKTEEPSKEEPVDEVEETVESLKKKLQESEDLVEELTEANQALSQEYTQTIAEVLVDLRVSLGKELNKEEAISKYSERTVESLVDSIKDLLEEKVVVPKAEKRQKESVSMPKGEKVVKESKELATKEKEVISNEEVIYNLLQGNKK